MMSKWILHKLRDVGHTIAQEIRGVEMHNAKEGSEDLMVPGPSTLLWRRIDGGGAIDGRRAPTLHRGGVSKYAIPSCGTVRSEGQSNRRTLVKCGWV